MSNDFTEIQVAVETPQHALLDSILSYKCERPLAAGSLVRVPLGKREVTGIVWPAGPTSSSADDLREIVEVCAAITPFSASWRGLVEFAASYYQRGVGEIALSVLPAHMRGLGDAGLANRLSRAMKPQPANDHSRSHPEPVVLSREQAEASARIGSALSSAEPGTVLLHGTTGSGKTEVYLRAADAVLGQGRQALVLVPEINLTPQLVSRFAARFPDRRIVSLHSGLTPAQRLRHWLLAHAGSADIILGTRLAVFASLPHLGLIVVDEEHDASYKQQEGARYSARDLAVWRGRNESVLVVLGSATPSLESWHRADAGGYLRLTMAERIGGATWPQVRLVDMNALPRTRAAAPALAPQLIAAMQERIARGEQSLVFLNRRGYAPVLHCAECDWKSGCPHCSAWRVFHRQDRTLRCHHCGLADAVPRACPDCGNPDIAPIGRGTERLEEQLGALLPGARIARIDADSVRRKGALEAQLGAVHAGEVDVLVGTQMIAKGHDFRRIGLVAAVNPDTSLFSSDFRAPERLFALLMQAAGRAGRDAAHPGESEMWLQTWHPAHPLYAALRQHDFAAFAQRQLDERKSAGLPPYSHLAVLRAEAKSAEAARSFLSAAAEAARTLPESEAVMVYAPVPLGIARVADVERMQMLVESASRHALQAMLRAWLPLLQSLRSERKAPEQRLLRWAVDVDPLAI
jgi:primosomal protein N' (replication factor Y) (superfamily II helicase)